MKERCLEKGDTDNKDAYCAVVSVREAGGTMLKDGSYSTAFIRSKEGGSEREIVVFLGSRIFL